MRGGILLLLKNQGFLHPSFWTGFALKYLHHLRIKDQNLSCLVILWYHLPHGRSLLLRTENDGKLPLKKLCRNHFMKLWALWESTTPSHRNFRKQAWRCHLWSHLHLSMLLWMTWWCAMPHSLAPRLLDQPDVLNWSIWCLPQLIQNNTKIGFSDRRAPDFIKWKQDVSNPAYFFRWTPRRRWTKARCPRRRRVAKRRHPSAAATAIPSMPWRLMNVLSQSTKPKCMRILLLTQCIGSGFISMWECRTIRDPETLSMSSYVLIKESSFRIPYLESFPIFYVPPWWPTFTVPI